MFAGPNGSGKSTLKEVLPQELLGAYVNPDQIEAFLNQTGSLPLAHFGVSVQEEAVRQFFRGSPLLANAGLTGIAAHVTVVDNCLLFAGLEINSYVAAVTSDFIRRQLLAQHADFTCETVMSSPDKVELLLNAQRAGYRTYLYYIATDDPEINVARVRSRVHRGGHTVPEDKIRSRYVKSLDLLWAAVQHTNRAYIFDNSSDGQSRTWLAEVTDGKEMVFRTDRVPAWFKIALWDKMEKAKNRGGH
jgi:predicted ABC-type ATPase